jgi:DNA-binding MarR family transcriptional regulator
MATPAKSKRRAPVRALTLQSLLNQAHRQATADLRRVVGVEGLPVEFWRVLEVLSDEQGRSMSELAQQAGMQLPATSKLVDRMTEAALIQRSADVRDQRRVVLHISDFGLQKVAALRKDVRDRDESIGRAFGPRPRSATPGPAHRVHPGAAVNWRIGLIRRPWTSAR